MQPGVYVSVSGNRAGAQGLAGWVLDLLRSRRGEWAGRERQMRLLETLPLGGKRQLMLVSCNDEEFLVGCGPESVTTIVRTGDRLSGSVAEGGV
jgi:hypothetical protein